MERTQRKLFQENKCLQCKAAIDYVRTSLMLIEDFSEFDRYDRILKNLKKKVDKIYWSL